ncbi:hypothetical protein RCL1_006624 [Eukaryota sp. TZLM3-RCL]
MLLPSSLFSVVFYHALQPVHSSGNGLVSFFFRLLSKYSFSQASRCCVLSCVSNPLNLPVIRVSSLYVHLNKFNSPGSQAIKTLSAVIQPVFLSTEESPSVTLDLLSFSHSSLRHLSLRFLANQEFNSNLLSHFEVLSSLEINSLQEPFLIIPSLPLLSSLTVKNSSRIVSLDLSHLSFLIKLSVQNCCELLYFVLPVDSKINVFIINCLSINIFRCFEESKFSFEYFLDLYVYKHKPNFDENFNGFVRHSKLTQLTTSKGQDCLQWMQSTVKNFNYLAKLHIVHDPLVSFNCSKCLFPKLVHVSISQCSQIKTVIFSGSYEAIILFKCKEGMELKGDFEVFQLDVSRIHVITVPQTGCQVHYLTAYRSIVNCCSHLLTTGVLRHMNVYNLPFSLVQNICIDRLKVLAISMYRSECCTLNDLLLFAPSLKSLSLYKIPHMFFSSSVENVYSSLQSFSLHKFPWPVSLDILIAFPNLVNAFFNQCILSECNNPNPNPSEYNKSNFATLNLKISDCKCLM